MAIIFTLICDECGGTIHASCKSIRAARAEAQLEHKASCGGGVDRCASCRLERGRQLLDAMQRRAPAQSHSIGTRR